MCAPQRDSADLNSEPRFLGFSKIYSYHSKANILTLLLFHLGLHARMTDAEEDEGDLNLSFHGLPQQLEAAATVLLDSYIARTSAFWVEVASSIDRSTALEFFKQIVSGASFKEALSSSTSLETRIDLFFFCALFATSARSVRRFDLGHALVIRASRVLQTIMATNVIASVSLSAKVLQVFPWYYLTLLALGLDEMMRQAVVYQQYLALAHSSPLSAAPMSAIFALSSAITRDYSQRLRWVQSLELFNDGSIPPHNDASRCQILASDILLQEDGMFPWEALQSSEPSLASSSTAMDTSGNTSISISTLDIPLGANPSEAASADDVEMLHRRPFIASDEIAYREAVLQHIDAALAKLPGHPTYAFRDFDKVQRCVDSAFAASKAVTLAVLGRLAEAEALAVAALTTIQPKDIAAFTTTAVIAMFSAMQVIVATRRTDLVAKGFAMLNTSIPEYPRAVRVVYKMAHRLKEMGISVAELVAESDFEEAALFSNLNFHSQSVLAPILATLPSSMLPTGAVTSPLLPPTFVARVKGSPKQRASAFTLISKPALTSSITSPITSIIPRKHIPGSNPYASKPHRSHAPKPSPSLQSSFASSIAVNALSLPPPPSRHPQHASSVLALQQQQMLRSSTRAPLVVPQHIANNVPGVTTVVGGQLRSMPISSPWDFMTGDNTMSWGPIYDDNAPTTASWPLTSPMPQYTVEDLSDGPSFRGPWTMASPLLSDPPHPFALLVTPLHTSTSGKSSLTHSTSDHSFRDALRDSHE